MSNQVQNYRNICVDHFYQQYAASEKEYNYNIMIIERYI